MGLRIPEHPNWTLFGLGRKYKRKFKIPSWYGITFFGLYFLHKRDVGIDDESNGVLDKLLGDMQGNFRGKGSY